MIEMRAWVEVSESGKYRCDLSIHLNFKAIYDDFVLTKIYYLQHSMLHNKHLNYKPFINKKFFKHVFMVN